VHEALAETSPGSGPDQIVGVAALLAAMVAAGEGGRVRQLGAVLRECGAPVMPGFRLAVGELASLSRALLTVPSFMSRRMPPDDAEFFVRAAWADKLQRICQPDQRLRQEIGGARYAALRAQHQAQTAASVAAIHAGAVASDLVHAASASLRHGDEDDQGVEGESGEGVGSLPDVVEDVLLMLVSASVVCCTTQDPAGVVSCPVVSAFAQVGAAGNASAWAGEAAARLPQPLRNDAAVLAWSCHVESALSVDEAGAARVLVDSLAFGAAAGPRACGSLFATLYARDSGGHGGGGRQALCTLALGAFAQHAVQRVPQSHSKFLVLDRLRLATSYSARQAARYYERWPDASACVPPPLRDWLAHRSLDICKGSPPSPPFPSPTPPPLYSSLFPRDLVVIPVHPRYPSVPSPFVIIIHTIVTQPFGCL